MRTPAAPKLYAVSEQDVIDWLAALPKPANPRCTHHISSCTCLRCAEDRYDAAQLEQQQRAAS